MIAKVRNGWRVGLFLLGPEKTEMRVQAQTGATPVIISGPTIRPSQGPLFYISLSQTSISRAA